MIQQCNMSFMDGRITRCFARLSLLALSFADNALKEDSIQCPEDLSPLRYTLEEALAIQWKPELLETPIFRRQVNSEISDSGPWTALDFNYRLKRLGFLSGYPQSLSSYVLRRGTANAIAVGSSVVERYCLLTPPRPRNYRSSAKLDNGPCTS